MPQNNPTMAKDKTMYVCENCGQESPKWVGKCPACGQWNTFKEIRVSSESGTMAARSAAQSVRSGGSVSGKNHPQLLRDISAKDEPRISTGDGELDRVLGGGPQVCR